MGCARDRLSSDGGTSCDPTEPTGAGTLGRSYAYDADGRVTEERQNGIRIASYVYDPQGNRTELHRYDATTGAEIESRSATYDARDRLLNDGVASYTYDAAGRRASKTVTATGDVTRYAYDELGHLTRVELPSGTTVEYTYDALGRRTGRTTDGAVDGPTDTAWVYGAGPAPIAALTGDGTLRATFTYGTRSWVPDVVHIQNGPETPGDYVILTDHRGSVRYVAGDVTTDVSDYDAFGHRMGLGITIVGFGFAGGINDIQTGLVHLGARDFDPETGRWIEPDPIRFAGGDTNLYAYVGGDAVNAVDPSGTVVVYVGIGGGGGVAIGVSGSVGVYFGTRRDGSFDAGFFATGTYSPIVVGVVAAGTVKVGLLFGDVEDFAGDSIGTSYEGFLGQGGRVTVGHVCHGIGENGGPLFGASGVSVGLGLGRRSRLRGRAPGTRRLLQPARASRAMPHACLRA